MLQSYHQNAEQFEIMFNKTKYDALPEKMKAIIANAVEAASQDMSWKAIDRYSKDYIELQTKDKVKFYKTPDAILQRSSRSTTRSSKKKSARTRCSRRSSSRSSPSPSARRSGSRTRWSAARWRIDHYFGPNAKKKI
jgi:TRAP-type mannitol/chloroaromatic compound transport system substrate-binding protein